MHSPICIAICGTIAFPNPLSLSTRLGIPLATRPTEGSVAYHSSVGCLCTALLHRGVHAHFAVPHPSPQITAFVILVVGVGHICTVFDNPAPFPVFGFIPLRSVAVGVGHIFTWSAKFAPNTKLLDLLILRPLSSNCLGPPVPSVVLGVAHNPKPISSVWGVDGTSWNNKRLAGVAFGFQVRKHCVEPHADVSINIFANNPIGSFCFNNAEYFRPDVAVIFASLLPGDTKWLARVSCCEDVAVWNKSIWVICQLLYVFSNLNIRPLLASILRDQGSISQNKHVRYSYLSKTKSKAPDSRTQVYMFEHNVLRWWGWLYGTRATQTSLTPSMDAVSMHFLRRERPSSQYT